jgi:hypothetical protein
MQDGGWPTSDTAGGPIMGAVPLAISAAFTFASGTPFSRLRDRDTSTSSMSSQSALCTFRSITAAVLVPRSSVRN